MSVYIPGMKMPQRDEVITIYPDGTAHRHHLRLRLHISESKAVPVPEHGRLIDADKLGKPGTIEEDTLWRGRIETEVYLASTIYNAPTVIPADKEGEG